MLGTAFEPWPRYSDEEIDAVAQVLRTGRVNYWTGDECRQFEQEFAAYVGSRYAIALTNGTVALNLALLGLGVGPGDEVIVTSRSFIASASSVVNAHATPVFADVERDSGNLSAKTISAVLTERTKAILLVHLAGWPADMDPIMELARSRGIAVIEDCAQAHGAQYRGRSVGSIGHIGAWSFCQDKIMTTGGEGGMVTLDDEQQWRAMWAFKDHGKSWEAVYEREHSSGFRWLHESFGTNWRMMEMQAVIGRLQLQRLAAWREARTRNANMIAQALEPLAGVHGPVRVPQVPPSVTHAYYRFYCYVRPDKLASGWSRDKIVAEINASGVPCYQGSCPEIYLEKAFSGTGHRPARRLEVARELGETSLMFLVHPTLTSEQAEKTAAVAAKVLGAAAH